MISYDSTFFKFIMLLQVNTNSSCYKYSHACLPDTLNKCLNDTKSIHLNVKSVGHCLNEYSRENIGWYLLTPIVTSQTGLWVATQTAQIPCTNNNVNINCELHEVWLHCFLFELILLCNPASVVHINSTHTSTFLASSISVYSSLELIWNKTVALMSVA